MQKTTNRPPDQFCLEIQSLRRNGGFSLKLISFSKGIAHVSTPSGAPHLVNLHESTCTCLKFQARHLPCRHAMAFCKDLVLEPEEFTSSIYTVENYGNIYSESFAIDLIRVEDLESSAF